jgi:hypothetical protein
MLNRTASFLVRLLASMVLIGLAVAGCTTTDGTAQGSLGDLGSSLGSSFGKNTDTNGTSRRPDVCGGFTRPTLPSIASR